MELLLNFWSFLVFMDISRYFCQLLARIFVDFARERGREGWRPLYFTAAASDTRRKLWKPGHHFIFPFSRLIPIHRRPNLDFNSFFGPCAFYSHASVLHINRCTHRYLLMSCINWQTRAKPSAPSSVCATFWTCGPQVRCRGAHRDQLTREAAWDR